MTSEIIIPHVCQNTGEMGCGDLMIALMKAMRPLEPGQILELYAADSGAREDIPAWCNMTGHKLLAASVGEDKNTYYIQKKLT